jgi:hypothetical protein
MAKARNSNNAIPSAPGFSLNHGSIFHFIHLSSQVLSSTPLTTVAYLSRKEKKKKWVILPPTVSEEP